MMTRLELGEHLAALRLGVSEVAQLLGVSDRTVRRWLEGESVPGPVESALRAWRRLDERLLPWKPDSISIFDNDQAQAQRMAEYTAQLAVLIREVEGRGGPKNLWNVELAKQTATFGPAEVGFYRLKNGGFSPTTYRRLDRQASADDMLDIQDACYCIAQAFSRARASNRALVVLAEYARRNAQTTAWDGPKLPNEDEKSDRARLILAMADQLDELAIAALERGPAYAEFERILGGMHNVGFFPDLALVSEVARSALGPATPDVLEG